MCVCVELEIRTQKKLVSVWIEIKILRRSLFAAARCRSEGFSRSQLSGEPSRGQGPGGKSSREAEEKGAEGRGRAKRGRGEGEGGGDGTRGLDEKGW